MRTKELDVITSVANRIAHFEQKQSPVSDHNSTGGGGGYSQKSKSQRLTPSSFSSRYLDLDDIMEEESSIETEDSSGEDSGGYHVSSSEHTSSSPDTSFRLSPGSRSSSSRSDRDNIPPCSSGSISAPAKTNISEKLSQKSLDSGFSDYSDGKEAGGGGGGGGGDSAAQERRLKSSVVHETHATKDSKLHHVSKVYFYSVSELLQEGDTQYEDHLTLLKNEAAASSSSPGPATPRISSAVCEEDWLERVESPFIPITSPAHHQQPGGVASVSPFQRCPRVHTGTSSLRRKQLPASECGGESSCSPARRCVTPSQSPFPLTNGSLYSDLSLGRRGKEQQRKLASSSSTCSAPPSTADTDTDNQNSESPFPSLNSSIPLENYGLNVSTYR